MKYHNIVRLQPVLACAISWQSTPAALADSTVAHAKFTGAYLSQKSGPSMDLSLGADGSDNIHSMNFRDSALTRTQEYAGNVIVLRCIPHEAVEVNHDAIQ